MNVALALGLILTTNTQTPATFRKFDFQDMLDSAQVVIIGRVDSIWYSLETAPQARCVGGILPLTNVYVKILSTYTRDSILIPSTNSLHLVHTGGTLPDGSFVEVEDGVKFREDEVFLASVQEYPLLSSREETIYIVTTPQWKYTIANDSVYLLGEEPISLDHALQSLSSNFMRQR